MMSLPDYMVEEINQNNRIMLADTQRENLLLLQECKKELEQKEQQLFSVEQKFIVDQITHETYEHWYRDITNHRINLKARIDDLSRDEEENWYRLSLELEQLTDLRFLYNDLELENKQEFLRMVFDNRLYYQSKAYRTPYVMEAFTHNLLEMREKGVLFVDGWDPHSMENLVRWSWRGHNRTLADLLSFIHQLKVA